MKGAITVVDANECAGEGQTSCRGSTVCDNYVGAFDCLDECDKSASGQCQTGATCQTISGGGGDACKCADGFFGSSSCNGTCNYSNYRHPTGIAGSMLQRTRASSCAFLRSLPSYE